MFNLGMEGGNDISPYLYWEVIITKSILQVSLYGNIMPSTP